MDAKKKRAKIIINVEVPSPCKECTERRLGCHIDCEAYACYRVEVLGARQAKRMHDMFDEVNNQRDRDRNDWMQFRNLRMLNKKSGWGRR